MSFPLVLGDFEQGLLATTFPVPQGVSVHGNMTKCTFSLKINRENFTEELIVCILLKKKLVKKDILCIYICILMDYCMQFCSINCSIQQEKVNFKHLDDALI